MRLGDRLADLAHRLEVYSQGVLKIPARFFLGVTNGRAPVNIRRICGIARPCWFDDYWITFRAHFNPAFLSISISWTLSGRSASPIPSCLKNVNAVKVGGVRTSRRAFL